MVAAEAGADYIMFGSARMQAGEPRDASPGAPKCSSCPASPLRAMRDEIAPLVAAGADFIALDYIWREPRRAANCSPPPRATCACRRPRRETDDHHAGAVLLAFDAHAHTSRPVSAACAEAGARRYDSAFGAYQRGYFLTAFKEATELAAKNDPQAMTLLAELYANGLGVGRDDAKAARMVPARRRRAAIRRRMFALAMFRFQGRGGPRDDEAPASTLFEQAAKLGNTVAAYNLGLHLSRRPGLSARRQARRRAVPQRRARRHPEAQYALATLYKEGSGVPKDEREATRLMRQAALAGNLDAMVEFGIAQFNGTGPPKNEAAAAQLLLKAARRGTPIAQNRLARIYVGRPRRARQSGRSDQMAHDRQGGRRAAIPSSTLRRQAKAGRSRRRRQGSQAVARDRCRHAARLDAACHGGQITPPCSIPPFSTS